MRAVVLATPEVHSEGARPVSAVLAAILLVAPVWANAGGTEPDGAPAAVPAVWNKVKRTLLALGARKDLKVEAWSCPIGQIPWEPQVAIRMQVLKVPAKPPTDPNGIRAHWKSIDMTDHYGPLSPDECALAKRIVDSLLPSFSTRNVEYNSPSCDRTVNPPDVHLRLEVLVTDQS
jgi:hypothetical protein